MTGHHHHRKAPPVPGPMDLKLWRDLISRAEKAARRPTSDTQPLLRAAMRATKAVMPVGHQHGQSPFVELIAAARGFWVLAPVARPDRADALADKAALCRAILNGENDRPERPLRKDIFE